MRSLVVASALPLPVNGGDAMRTLQNAVSLTSKGPVGVFGLRTDAPTRPPLPDIELWRSSRDVSLTDLSTATSLEWLRDPSAVPWDQFFSQSALGELDEAIAQLRPGVIVLESLSLYRYLEPLAGRDFRVVLDLQNVYSVFYRDLAERSGAAAKMVRRELAARSDAIERAAFGLADQVWVCSQVDAELVRGRVDPASIAVVPNTIDVGSYTFERRSSPRPTMTFPAMFAYPPNETAALFLAREVVPRLAERFEALRLVLVGREPTAAMLDAAAGDPRVVVTGSVPDVRPYLAEAGAMPMPLFDGSGTRLKALEAFATGVPVVSTAKGLEGLAVAEGEHYLRAEDADEFVDALTRLWDEPGMAAQLADQARVVVTREYSWDAARRDVAAALDRLRP